ncbi:MAG: TIGR00375 family protein [Candidatus Eremiobacteraeota bacterium]|nr:TIGR00375 family protein [Candidatus Eremiobacteraeota bacterium]MCW5870802.1 TIGR00375 family protein [Candidatus Eremiobacteraeota bacterium]
MSQLDFGFAEAVEKEERHRRAYVPVPEKGEDGLRRYYADLHVHIGRNGRGQPVKITASPDLVLHKVVEYAWQRKGLDLVGVIDCACTGVLQDLRALVDRGHLLELPEGGLRHRDQITLIPGAEVEAVETHGGVSHHLCYFPYLRNLSEFSTVMRRYITNMELSSQRCGLPARELMSVVQACGGVLVPAHAFTPHKSVYGNAADRLSDLFGDLFEDIPALELGLSATAELADRLPELADKTFVTNSDAHSLERMAREYTVMRLAAPNFREVLLAWRRQQGRRVEANYGVDPALGRYHRSYCLVCDQPRVGPEAVLKCWECGAFQRKDFVRGVFDRILELSSEPSCPPAHRPPYILQIPLNQQTGLGMSRLNQLVAAFGNEMNVIHQATMAQLVPLVGYRLAEQIVAARSGQVTMQAGAGGRYGKLVGVAAGSDQLSLF